LLKRKKTIYCRWQ